MKIAKRVGLLLGSLVFLVLTLLIVLPWFLSVDQYRSFIVQKINEKINGHCQLGKLELSLWGKVRLQVAGLTLQDSLQKELLNVPAAWLETSLMSLWSSEPQVVFVLQKPTFFAKQDASGSWNWSTLMAAPASLKTSFEKNQETPQKPSPSASASKPFLESLSRKFLQASLDCEVREASLQVESLSSASWSLDGLQGHLKNAGPNRVSSWSLRSDLQWQSEDLTLSGPWSLDGKIEVTLPAASLKLTEAKGSFHWEGKALELRQAQTVLKAKQTPCSVQGTFQTDLVHSIGQARWEGPESDLEVHLKAEHNPVFVQLQARSKQLNVDALLGRKPHQTVSSSSPSTPPATSALQTASAQKQWEAFLATDYDTLLKPLRQNEFLQKLRLEASIEIDTLLSQGLPVSSVKLKGQWKERQWHAPVAQLKLWGSDLSFPFSLDLRQPQPLYTAQIQVKAFPIQEAVAWASPQWKDTLKGKWQARISTQGKSFRPGFALQNLQTSGELHWTDAEWNSLDAQKMITEGLQTALKNLSQKHPALARVSLPTHPLSAQKVRYEKISSQLHIAGGTLSFSSFQTSPSQPGGLTLEGQLSLQLLNGGLQSRLMLSDIQNVMGLQTWGVELEGVRVEPLLVAPGKIFQIPVSVGCFVNAPCYSYPEIPEFLGRIALSQIEKSLKRHATQGLQKKAGELLEKNLPPAVKEKLPGALPGALKEKLKGWF